MSLAEQKIIKPAYDELATMLCGQIKDNFDEFVSYLKSIKLVPKWYATNAYHVKFKGKMIFRFSMGNDWISLFFTVSKPSDLNKVISLLPSEMQKYYYKNLRRCLGCNPTHGKGKRIEILDNEYWICAEPEMRIDNPTKEDIEILKKFISVRKENIVNTAV